MDEAQTWRDRLEAELGRSKRAARDVSVKAGAAPGDLIRSMPRRRVQFPSSMRIILLTCPL